MSPLSGKVVGKAVVANVKEQDILKHKAALESGILEAASRAAKANATRARRGGGSLSTK